MAEMPCACSRKALEPTVPMRRGFRLWYIYQFKLLCYRRKRAVQFLSASRLAGLVGDKIHEIRAKISQLKTGIKF